MLERPQETSQNDEPGSARSAYIKEEPIDNNLYTPDDNFYGNDRTEDNMDDSDEHS